MIYFRAISLVFLTLFTLSAKADDFDIAVPEAYRNNIPHLVHFARAEADKVAEILAKQNTGVSDGFVNLLNQHWNEQAQQTQERLARAIESARSGIEQNAHMLDLVQLQSRSFITGENVLFLSSTVCAAMGLLPMAIFGPSEVTKMIAQLTPSVGFLGCFALFQPHRAFMRNLVQRFGQPHAQKNYTENAIAKLREGMLKIFFTRLSELGVKYDRKRPLEWLLDRLDGNPLPQWEKLSRAEKAASAKKLEKHFRELAALFDGTNPELSKEFLESAEKVKTAVPAQWWAFWGRKTIRTISQTISETYKHAFELDQKYRFSSDPKVAEFFYDDQRVLVDYADIFDPQTREFLMRSRLSPPPHVAEAASKLRDLGAQIKLNWDTAPDSALGGGKVKTNFHVVISFPATAQIPAIQSDTFGVTYPTEAKETHLLPWMEMKNYAIEFRAGFRQVFDSSQIMEMITEMHQERFPEKHCDSALTNVNQLPIAAAELLQAAP